MNAIKNDQAIDFNHTYAVDELKNTLHERTPELDLYLWRCPYGRRELVFEGFAKCDGGIKHLVHRYKKVSLQVAKNHVLKYGTFSPRPYQLAQACDGSTTTCALALFARFCRDCGHDADTLLRAAYPDGRKVDWNETVASADWEGVAYPAQWDEGAKAGLLESLHEVNYHSLASVVSDLPAPRPQMVPNSYQEPKPAKLLKITERFYGKVIYTSQADIDRANQLGRVLIRCRCLNGRLVSHYHEEMGWHNKVGTVFHREYLDGATIEEVEVKP